MTKNNFSLGEEYEIVTSLEPGICDDERHNRIEVGTQGDFWTSFMKSS